MIILFSGFQGFRVSGYFETTLNPLHRCLLQEPIKEAGILEGRNGIKETMLQHAARYLADQDWVKTDSMKTIENTAVPIIQLVAQMPLQPLQASSPPSEKAPEESVPGLHSPRDGLSDENVPPLMSEQTPSQTLVHGMSAPEGVTGEERGSGNSSGDHLSHPARSLSAPGAETSVRNGPLGQLPSKEGVQTPLETVPFAEIAGGAARHPGLAKQIRRCQSDASDVLSSVDKASSSLSGRSAVLTCGEGGRSAEGAKAEAALRRPLGNDRGASASDGGLDSGMIDSEKLAVSSEESETGFREKGGAHVHRIRIQGELMHARAEADLGYPEVGLARGDTAGVCSLGADTAAGSGRAFSAEPGVTTSARDPSPVVGSELSGAGGREGARADVSANVGADVGTLERRASDAGDLEGNQMSVLRGLELRERERAQDAAPKEGGPGKLQPNVMKSGGGRHVPLIRTRADVDQLERGHMEGAHSPADQERRLVKLDISFEGVQHTGSRTTDLVGFLR